LTTAMRVLVSRTSRIEGWNFLVLYAYHEMLCSGHRMFTVLFVDIMNNIVAEMQQFNIILWLLSRRSRLTEVGAILRAYLHILPLFLNRNLYSTEARVYSDRWLPRVPPRDPTSKLFRPRTMFFRCVDPCKSFFPV